MSQEKKYDVFISYSRKDSAIADEICKAFDRVGITYFIDRKGIGGTANYVTRIAEEIDNSKTMLLLASANSYQSKYVSIELHYAFEQEIVVLPYVLDETQVPKDFKILLIRANWHYINEDSIVPKLLTSIAELIGKKEELASKIDKLEKEIKDLELQKKNASKKEETTKFPIFFSEYEGPVIHIFFLIDCSGSMLGRRIEEVDYACSEVLRNLSIINPDVDIKVNVLCFESDVYWISDTPAAIDEFCWQRLRVGGLTNFGGACVELNRKLCKDGFFAPYYSSGRYVMPSLIILMTDGEPTDDYIIPLEELQKNSSFKRSNRFAIGLGNECNQSILEKFAGKKKVFIIPDEEEKLGLKPMLERILHMGLYAGSCAMLDEE